MPNVTDEQRDAFLASNTQAEGARILKVDGKTYREGTRRGMGVYVSHTNGRTGEWDARTRAFRLALHERDGDARAAVIAAWKNGDDAPPIIDDAPPVKATAKK